VGIDGKKKRKFDRILRERFRSSVSLQIPIRQSIRIGETTENLREIPYVLFVIINSLYM